MKRNIVAVITVALIAGGCNRNDASDPLGPPGPGGEPPRVFVNPLTGSDRSSGTYDTPFRTIHRALSTSVPGEHILLFPGIYAASQGEIFPDSLPHGITIEAMNPGQSLLAGDGVSYAFSGAGSDTLRDLAFTAFSTVFTASSGNHVIHGSSFANANLVFLLSRNARMTAINCTMSDAAVASCTDAAQLSLTACAISGASAGDLIFLQRSARLVMDNSTVRDAPVTGIGIHGNAEAVLDGCVLSAVSPDGIGGSATVDVFNSSHLVMRRSTIAGADGAALIFHDPGIVASINNCSFYGNGTAGGSGSAVVAQNGGTVVVDSSLIGGSNGTGYVLTGGSLVMRYSTISAHAQSGLSASDGTSLFVRTTEISSCRTGIVLAGNTSTADLGTTTLRGGNSFRNNTQWGLRVGYTGGTVVQAVGNAWMPGNQGADASGQYTSTLISGPVNSGAPSNYYIDSNGGKIQF